MSIFSLVQDRNVGTKLNADEAFLASINGLIKHELCNPDFGASQLAEQLGVSRGHLSRQLLALVSCPPGQYILMMRLELASHLLLEGREPIKNVALISGFRSYASFWRAFSRTFQCSPAAYGPSLKTTTLAKSVEWSFPLTEAFRDAIHELMGQKPFVKNLLGLLLTQIGSDEVTLDVLAQRLYLSPSQLLRNTKRLLGITPLRLLYQLRVLKAAALLQDSSLRLTDIAYTAGFFDQAHMSRAFKAVFHCSPRQYRMRGATDDSIQWLKNMVV